MVVGHHHMDETSAPAFDDAERWREGRERHALDAAVLRRGTAQYLFNDEEGLSCLADADLQPRPNVAAVLHDRRDLEPLEGAGRQVAPGAVGQPAAPGAIPDHPEGP